MSDASTLSQRLGRVAFYSPSWPPGQLANGIVTYVATARRGLARLGVETAVVAGGGRGVDSNDVVWAPSAYRKMGVRPRLWNRALAVLRPTTATFRELAGGIAAGLRALERTGAVPLLEIEESFGLAPLIRRTFRGRIIVRIHGPWFLTAPALGLPNDTAFRTRVAWEREGLVDADGVSAPSQVILDRVRAELNIALPRASVIPNPAPEVVDAKRWSAGHCERDLLLFVGRFDRLKGADLVIEAFRQVSEQWPGVRLVVAGPDTGLVDEGGRAWSAPDYVRSILPEAVCGRVHLMGGITPGEVAALRKRAFLTLVASRQENFPMVLLEAMAQGCPVIAPRVGGIPEIVESGRNGLLFEAGNASDLATRILEAAAKPEWTAALGASAAQDVALRFNPITVARSLVRLYESVLASPRQRA